MKRIPFILAGLVCAGTLWGQEARVYKASVPRPTQSGVRYGLHERHIIDFWRAQSDRPTPLVFMIHGGGWCTGDMTKISKYIDVQALLDHGISVCAIHYRFLSDAGSVMPPVKVPLSDATRALQTVRSRAAEWNIDPDQIYAVGGSAGACTSLWLALHDEMADPASADPIARQSTRLAGAAVCYPQTTLDPKKMKNWTPNSRYGGRAFGKEVFQSFLNAREELLPWIQEYSPLHHLSADDPEIYMTYKAKPRMGKAVKDPTHTANFGVKFLEKCRELGVACELSYPGKKGVHRDVTSYLLDRIGREKETN